MRTVYKYHLELADRQMALMPAYPQCLSIQDQHGKLTVWALVDTDQPMAPVDFRVFGTGHEADVLGFTYLGTVQQGPFVWHVWWRS